MRPQQQNRRMRGRNSGGNNGGGGNRKGPNPLTRNYESNGPDVKIRGSAQQIAEKYATLARDAQSSGDRVMAENYLQHAEHYNRIIAAAMAQMPIQQQQQQHRDDFDADMDDERDDDGNIAAEAPAQQGDHVAQSQPQPVVNGTGPQPDIEGMPAEVALNPEAVGEVQPREGRRERRPRHEGRRPDRRQQDQAQAKAAEVPQAEPVEPVAVEAVAAPAAPVEAAPIEVAEGEVVAAPRRVRRPRRVAVAEAEADAPAPDAGLAVAES